MRLYGKNSVIERLKTDPKSISKLYMQAGHAESGYIYQKARKWGIPVHAMSKMKMEKISRNLNTQGVLAEVGDFSYTDFDELLDKALSKKISLLFLDGLTDPQNLGGIIRSLACLSGFSIVLPSKDSVSVTESVLRIACGGENYVSIAQVANLSKAIRKAQDKGFSITGAVVGEGDDIRKTKVVFPTGLVIGSEQKGIRPVIRKVLDQVVTLPMPQNRVSLNAAHATTIFCYEINRQRL